VPDVTLTESRQAALRSLLRAEPVPGDPLPPPQVFDALQRLVPCDLLEVSLTDERGTMLALAGYAPTGHGRCRRVLRPLGAEVGDEHGGPFYTGWMHWTRNPEMAEGCGVELEADDLSIGFANGLHDVVQYGFVRDSRPFSEEELAVFHMLVPTLGRLVRERPTPGLPRHLTAGERTVLGHVAAGQANAEIAEAMGVSVSTVRKHLENAYRKLGVSNRVAAVAHLHGTAGSCADLRQRLQAFA
jgi:DNA-binding CsgD family transcriptional regulator